MSLELPSAKIDTGTRNRFRPGVARRHESNTEYGVVAGRSRAGVPVSRMNSTMMSTTTAPGIAERKKS